MKSLLLVAHGSRRAESNEEIRQLTSRVAAMAAEDFELIDCAFLELAEPLIPDGIQHLVQQGATSVLVLPYFLAKGAHVASDIPEQVDQAKANNPDIAITTSQYFGASEAVPELLVKLATSSG